MVSKFMIFKKISIIRLNKSTKIKSSLFNKAFNFSKCIVMKLAFSDILVQENTLK